MWVGKLSNFLGTKIRFFTRTVHGLNQLERSSSIRSHGLVEPEIFHQLPVILVDRGRHVLGPMIVLFVQFAAKRFQSLLADCGWEFNTGIRNEWLAGSR